MCEPTTATLMYASLAATAASTAMQVHSSQQQASHSRAVGRYNARVQENQAKEVRNKAIEQENQARQEASQLQSKQSAIAASRGVLATEGTALQTLEDTKLIGDINALRIRQNAEDQAAALETQSVLTRSGADAKATAAINQGNVGALESAGKVAAGWYQLSNTPSSS